MNITIKSRTCNFIDNHERDEHFNALLDKKRHFENAERNTDVFCQQLAFDRS